MPVWHISFSFRAATGAVGVRDLRPGRIEYAIGLGRQELNGVGSQLMAFTTDPPGVAIHVQKPLRDSEIALLPAGWMEIPAVDELGPVKMLESPRVGR